MPSADRPILIVEDDCLLAFDLEDTLMRGGFARVESACTIHDALARLDRVVPAAAVLDFDIGGETNARLAHRLDALGVPYICVTGSPTRARAALPNVRVLAKPAAPQAVIAALARILEPA